MDRTEESELSEAVTCQNDDLISERYVLHWESINEHGFEEVSTCNSQ